MQILFSVMDPRHAKRIKIVQNLFALSFKKVKDNLPYKQEQTERILKNLSTIDSLIEKYATRFSLSRIAKIDLAILRLSIYELVIEKQNPPKVIIDEAVKLSKELGGQRSYTFINAVLGKIYQNIYKKNGKT